MADLTDNKGPASAGPGRDRKKLLEEYELSPTSLIGSWFHKLENDEMVWQGQVIGQPMPTLYLIEVQTFAEGAKDVQVLIDVQSMAFKDEGYEWRFYDTQEKAAMAFVAWSTSEARR